jgi:hypothetical protein
MSDKSVKVDIVVDNNALMRGFDETAEGAQTAVRQINDSFARSRQQVEMAILAVNTHLRRMDENFAGSAKGVKDSLTKMASDAIKGVEKLGGAAGWLSGHLGAIKENYKGWLGLSEGLQTAGKAIAPVAAAIYSVGRALGSCLSASTQWNNEAIRMAGTLGITTEKASVLNRALSSINVTSGEYESAAASLMRQVNSGGEAFERLGIKTKDANGNMRPTGETMQDAINKLNGIKQGADRTAAGMAIFGRSWGESQKLLKLNNETMAEAEACAKKLGIVVGADAVASQENWNKAMTEAKTVASNLKIAIGQELSSSISDFVGGLGECNRVAHYTTYVFKGIMTAVDALVFVVKTYFNVVATLFGVALSYMQRGASALMKLIKGDIKGFGQEIKGFGRDMKSEFSALFEEMGSNWDKVARRWKKPATGETRVGAQGDANFSPKDKNNGEGGNGRIEPGTLAMPWMPCPQLGQIKDMLAQEAGPYKDATNDKATALRKLADFEQSAAEMRARMAEGRRSLETELAMLAIEDERNALDHKVAMGLMSNEQRIQAERGFLEQMHGLRKQEIQWQLDNENLSIEQRAQLHNRLAAMEAEHQNRIAQNARQMAAAQNAIWDTLLNGVRSSMEDAFMGLCNGTMSWGKATQQVLNSVLQGFLQMTIKQLTQHITVENLKKLATKIRTNQEITDEAAAAAQKKAITASTATTAITANAMEGGSGAFTAMAKIPYVGPALGAAAMAAAIGAIMALLGKLSSAAGGWGQVPHDQLAAIHKDEMVLPAKYANPLREQLEGGEFGMAQGGGGNFNISINAIDGPSVERFIKGNGIKFARGMKEQARNFVYA